MSNFWNNILAGVRSVRKAYVISVLVVLFLILGALLYANGTFTRVSAVLRGEPPSVIARTQVEVTPTMQPMPGMETLEPLPGMGTTDPTMQGMAMPGTTSPTTGQSVDPNDLDTLTLQMQEMMNSLQGMMGQLDQKGAGLYLQPTAAPMTVDTQSIMAELQAINRDMAPLMLRIQADLQGNPSPEELASVRAQVEGISVRVGKLLEQLQVARGVTDLSMEYMPGMNMTPGMPGMVQPTQPANTLSQDPAQATRMAQLEQMMQQMQVILHQMQSGGQNGQPSTNTMPGMTGMPDAPASDPSMDNLMAMMDDMMATMDVMMGMGSSGSSHSPDPTTSDTTMNNMMMMMDNMMSMMDQMMNMSMPDM